VGRMSRDKGARGEREVKDLHNTFFKELGLNVQMQRNSSGQADGGGYDLVGLQFLAIEVKLQEGPYQEIWWKQCLEQCSFGQTAVLWYRRNRIKWRVRMIGTVENVEMLVDITPEDYFRWLKARLAIRSATQQLEDGFR